MPPPPSVIRNGLRTMIMADCSSRIAPAQPSRRFFGAESRDGDAADVPKIDRLDGRRTVVMQADFLCARRKSGLLAGIDKAKTAAAAPQIIGHAGSICGYRLGAGEEDNARFLVAGNGSNGSVLWSTTVP